MSIFSRFAKAVAREISEASLPHTNVRIWGRQGKPPDVSQEALVRRYWGWVYACSQFSSQAVASTPIRLYATRSTGERKARWPAKSVTRSEHERILSDPALKRGRQWGRIKAAQEIEEIFEHPILTLINNANSFTNGFELLELGQTMEELTGNEYWWLEGGKGGAQPTALYILRSQWTAVVPDKERFLKGYLYGRRKDKRIALDQTEVIHFKRPNPHDPWYGMGAVQAAAFAVQRQEGMDKWESATLQNMGRPDYVVKYTDGKLNTQKRIELETEWDNAFNDASRHFKVMDESFSVEPLGFNPREMAFLQGRPWTLKEIAAAFPVPEGLLDTSSLAKAPGATMERTQQFMAQYNTLPRIRRKEQKLNEHLTPRYDDRLFLAFDNPVPQDREYELKRTETALKNWVISVNEARAKDGLEPAEWGDVPLAPINIVPLGAAPTEPQPTPANERAARREPPTHTAHPKGTPIYADQADAFPAIFATKADAERTGGPNPPVSEEERTMMAVVTDIWARQEREAVAAVTKQSIAEDAPLIDYGRWIEETATLFAPTYWDPITRGGKSGFSELEPKLNLKAIDYDAEEWYRLLEEWGASQDVRDAVMEMSLEFAQQMNKATARLLREELKDAVTGFENVAQIKKRVQRVFGEFIARKRALMIARTESARAYTNGRLLAWAKSGVVTGKEWSAALDACPFCLDLHGTVVELDANYVELGDEQRVQFNDRIIRLLANYTPIAGPPLHPNCRCALAPVIIE